MSTKTRRQPQDATRRNVQASNAKHHTLARRLRDLAARVGTLEREFRKRVKR